MKKTRKLITKKFILCINKYAANKYRKYRNKNKKYSIKRHKKNKN